MDGCLTDLLLEQVYLGRKIDNGFHKDAWKDVVPGFNARCRMKLGKEHFKNRLRTWRKIYLSVKALLDHSGFRWDDKHKMVCAEDHVWEEYIKVDLPFPQRNTCIIFCQRVDIHIIIAILFAGTP